MLALLLSIQALFFICDYYGRWICAADTDPDQRRSSTPGINYTLFHSQLVLPKRCGLMD
jgi:hypothetical protein